MQGTLTSSLPLSVTGTEVAKTNISFWRFWTIFQKIGLLLTIVVPLVALIILLLLVFNGVSVIPSCRDIVFSVLLLLEILPSFIHTGGFSRLSRLGAGQSGGLTLGRLRFLGPRLLGLRFLDVKFLSLDLCQSDIEKVVASRAMRIQILDYGARF